MLCAVRVNLWPILLLPSFIFIHVFQVFLFFILYFNCSLCSYSYNILYSKLLCFI
jgi:hypothetical protein